MFLRGLICHFAFVSYCFVHFNPKFRDQFKILKLLKKRKQPSYNPGSYE